MEIALSLVAIVLSIASGIFSFYTFRWSVKHDRKQATLEAFNRLQNEVLDKLNLITKVEITEISTNAKTEEYKTVSKYLARIEHFCVGVNAKIYDIEIVKRLAGKYFIGLYDKCLPLIEKKREINKTAKHYDEFETTVTALRIEYGRK